MYLYNLSLQQSTAITQAIYGNFTAPKAQEIVVSKGTILELYQIDDKAKIQTIISKEVFGQIRRIMPFRLTGNNRDYIIVGSDSGRIVILEANLESRQFVKIHQETFGKTGVRRIVPGEYLAADPKGRAVMISAIEKQKFVYILNRDNNNKMTISSPLEAHKSHTICFDICGLDVGYENPLFASIEVDYGDPENETSPVVSGKYQKLLTYYEMDLGLNHVVRKNFENINNSAHLLIPVPGSQDGPGGVIICCENFITYKNSSQDISSPIPRRNEFPSDKGIMIVSYAMHKQKDLFFFLIQSELGDLYKVTLQTTSDIVHGVLIQYFDSIPTCTSICVLKNGYLFAASEYSNHGLYQFQSIGDNDDIAQSHSSMPNDSIITFNPRNLKNIVLIEELASLSCITDIIVEDLINEGNPQIYTLCGKGSRSSLRVLKHGLQVSEMASSSLPGKPAAIWTLKGSIGDIFDKYIIVSFLNATLVLSIGEKVLEIQNSGFDSKKPSLHVGLLEDNTYIQVFPNGIIHIKTDKRRNLYQTTSRILCATSNQRQIAVALQDKEIMYFELDSTSNTLTQIEKKVLESEIICLDIGNIPEGRQRCKFLAVGCADSTVKILSLELDTCLSRISTQALPSTPENVSLLEMNSANTSSYMNESSDLFLHIGLSNGVLLRTAVDIITGNLSDTRTKYLGNKPVSLFKVNVQGARSMLAVSSKPWLCYNFMSKYFITNLNYESIDFASCFASEQCNEGIVAIVNNSLRIFYFERLGEIFNQTTIPLRYTPRKMVFHPETNNIVIIESDHNSYSKREKEMIKQEISNTTKDPEYLKLKEDQIGTPYAGEGRWGSCIRMIDPYKYELLDLIEFEENEAAFTTCIMSFNNIPNELFLVVGTAKDMKLHPRSCTSASIIIFTFRDQGKKIEFLHRTPCEDVPLAFCEFHGRLLCGVGNYVRIYELGKKKLLKKSETKKLTSIVSGISVSGQRIFVNTISESFHVLRYKPNENQLYLFADDIIPRWITTAVILDYDTIAGADKFENFFICRLPYGCDEESEEDPMGTKHKWEIGYLNGAAFKMDQIAQYHRGELITSLRKCSLSQGSSNLLVYGTSTGNIGVFIPFENREEVDFFVHLEMYLRLESQPLCGRDHQAYRSSYAPVKCVVDGDLCEEFASLEYSKQKVLGNELDKSPNEVMKKLEEIRNKIL